MKNVLKIVAVCACAMAGIGALTLPADASSCTDYSTSWTGRTSCAGTRGYGQGVLLAGGVRRLYVVLNNGTQAGAVALDAMGAYLSSCKAIDTKAGDGYGVYVQGSVCASGVTHMLQVNYY